MHISLGNLTKLDHKLILTIFLLIFCKFSLAQDIEKVDDNNFKAFIHQVEELKDKNPSKAFIALDRQFEHLASFSTENQLMYYKVLAEVYVEQAQYLKSKEVATQGLTLARSLSSPSIITAELLYARGFAIESLGDYKAAREDYLNGLEIADSLNDKRIAAMGLVNIGALDYLTEKFDRSLIMFNDALAIAQQLNDDDLSGFVYAEMGILYSLINQEDKSLEFYQKSYEHYLKAGKVYYAYSTLRNIAASHSLNERYEKAIPIYKEVIEHADQIGNDELISYVYSGMAWAQIKQKNSDPEASYQYMLLASQYAENAQQVDFPIAHALDKGYLFMELGRDQEALESMIKAEQLLQQYEGSDQKMVSTISKLNVLYLKAELYHKLKDFKQAYLAQDQYINFVLSLPEKSNVDEVEDIRVRYESEQADLQNQILAQQESVQALLLSDANNDVKNRQFFIGMFALVAMVLAWFLVKTISGQKKLLVASRTDELTGVTNRRRLMQIGNKLVKQRAIHRFPLSILVIDVDDFKQINDQFGHKIGDAALRKIAQIGQDIMRAQDVFARYGGEEFIVILPDTAQDDAIEAAERLRMAVYQADWTSKQLHQVSVSIGVATLNLQEEGSFDQLLNKADHLMYVAKRQGKNRVCSHDD